MGKKVQKTNEEWLKQLGPEAYRVLRESGTEAPFSGKFNAFFEDGIYKCAGCGSPLFHAAAKFDGHCGWPSFDRALAEEAIITLRDLSHGMVRTEIRCAHCDGHLGHLFNDGPSPTTLRYCVNSVSLDFDKKEEE